MVGVRTSAWLIAAALAAGTIFVAATAGAGQSGSWDAVLRPAPGPARSIGSYANGCIIGAQALAAEGPGWQVIRTSRRRYYGHPAMIGYIERLGRAVAAAGLGTMLVGDIGQPQGGPMPNGHASHQIGLDADLWFRLDLPLLPQPARETLEERYMVDLETLEMRPEAWTPSQVKLLRLAASDQTVERIFVNPAIKQALCAASGPDRNWLGRLRPWWGHAAHFHVRLRCPADSPLCLAQTPAPPGDGCDEVPGWLADMRRAMAAPPPAKPAKPVVKPPLPTACLALLAGGSDLSAR
ncbi:MAG: penicillin-insensitive murein endopeptidase [Azospirillum sp.]|nr:penicillin-insensitive murein endopeptidase [Azospirillum sp.]